MAYFAPYIDGSGLHMPAYEDRLEELWDRYCEIFGVDPSSKTDPIIILRKEEGKCLNLILGPGNPYTNR